jgi:hypothetical protein
MKHVRERDEEAVFGHVPSRANTIGEGLSFVTVLISDRVRNGRTVDQIQRRIDQGLEQ